MSRLLFRPGMPGCQSFFFLFCPHHKLNHFLLFSNVCTGVGPAVIFRWMRLDLLIIYLFEFVGISVFDLQHDLVLIKWRVWCLWTRCVEVVFCIQERKTFGLSAVLFRSVFVWTIFYLFFASYCYNPSNSQDYHMKQNSQNSIYVIFFQHIWHNLLSHVQSRDSFQNNVLDVGHLKWLSEKKWM